FPGLTIPSLGLSFYGGMPADTPYTVHNYTMEYDGFADFPKYPLNVVSDLNAVTGIIFVHTQYLSISPTDVANAIQLGTSPGYAGHTTYYMIPTEHLPLLQPLRMLPGIGTPLADLIEPDLRVIVNLGYGDPAHGWSTTPADLTTPFELFPSVPATTLVNAFSAGTQEGINHFTADLHAMASQPMAAPTFSLPAAPN